MNHFIIFTFLIRKYEYDPENIFRFEQSIPLVSTTPKN